VQADVSLCLAEAYEVYKPYFPSGIAFDIYAAIMSLAS
jgi:hypothetical protein